MKQFVTLFISVLSTVLHAQVEQLGPEEGLGTGEVVQVVELPNRQILVNTVGAFQLFDGTQFVPPWNMMQAAPLRYPRLATMAICGRETPCSGFATSTICTCRLLNCFQILTFPSATFLLEWGLALPAIFPSISKGFLAYYLRNIGKPRRGVKS